MTTKEFEERDTIVKTEAEAHHSILERLRDIGARRHAIPSRSIS
ncbi:hypothetical protein BMS3Bbin01_01234 [bacterium BMS3Bbin01]|nr:hypothetical protein BMS3Bbin01_01234 [bacterium BMS3Bbin01]